MRIETKRLIITEFTMEMAEAVHRILLDADNKASVTVMERCGFEKKYEGLGPYQGAEREICRFLFTLSAK